MSSSVSTTIQPSFVKDGSKRRRRSARRLSTSSNRVMGLSPLPFTTVEDDPYVAPVLKVPAVQAAAGHDKDDAPF
jgi:hypothetical protein